MTAALIALALRFLGSKTGRLLVLIVAAIAAFGIYTAVIEHNAAERARVELIAKEKAATEAEHDRRGVALEAAQREAAIATARLAATENRNATLLERINRLSARNDRKPCLDRGSAQRLRDLDQNRRPAGDGAQQPAG
jgi:hypothetical protein